MELGAPLCPAIRKEMGLTNWPPRPKIHTASYLWASETLKPVDCVWRRRSRFLIIQQAGSVLQPQANFIVTEQSSIEGHSLMAAQVKLKSRYEIKEILGQGGMGVVYRAYDTVIRRDVALKTIRDIPDPSALETFQKECGVLASMAHPNIIEIFDLGEFEENGASKPYFVMPLLPGATLESLVRSSSQRLTVDRVVEIVSQTCRGLQAAHERGLVHRDLKPSNIFVMEDDSVKIIDFGVAHIVDTRTTMSLKGTLAYMAPEQIEMKPLSALSDVFSLGVVAYEAFTLRRPFQARTQSEMVEAILRQIPPPASDFNPTISQAVSRVIHKALAKQPWHRFASAREFAEILLKSFRNETVEMFDLARIQPRVERARKAFEQNDFQFASEILGELEAEGHIDPAISSLHSQIHQVNAAKNHPAAAPERTNAAGRAGIPASSPKAPGGAAAGWRQSGSP